MNWRSELDAALDAARLAGRVIRRDYERLTPDPTAAADVTTQTDRASQEAILRRLSDEFPGDGYRAEEATPAFAHLPAAGPRMWVVDPIDGTRGFVGKNGEFSVMIALVVGGEGVVGVVAEPACDRVTFARRGEGCWQVTGTGKAERVRVTAAGELAAAMLIQSHTKLARGRSPELQALSPARVVETYSAGVKLARVADGGADLYVCTYSVMNDWDLAAGHILVTEAGGRVTRLDGSPIRYGRPDPKQVGGLLATNGVLHDAAVSALGAM
jgi:3'(2'), 5'-bisphosphate nucleotidase